MKKSLALVATLGLTGAAFASNPVLVGNGDVTATRSSGLINPIENMVNPAACEVVWETFNDTFAPNYGTGWTLGGPGATGWHPAAQWTLSADAQLCEIITSATHVTGTNEYTIYLYEDGGSTPGAVIDSWVVTNLPQNQAGPTPLVTVDASSNNLDAGEYWVSIDAYLSGTTSTWGVLRWNTDPAYGSATRAYKNSSNPNWVPTSGNLGAWRVTADESAGGVSLAVSGNCPGTSTFTLTGGTPGGRAALAYGFGTGPTTIPNTFPCGGTQLNVGNPNFGYQTLVFDSNGNATFSTFVPQNACRVFVQGIDLTTCATSNVVNP